MSELFEGLGFLIVSKRVNSKPLAFKKSIYRKHKATLFYNLKSALSKANGNTTLPSDLRVILLDYDDSIRTKGMLADVQQTIVKALALKDSSDLEAIAKLPIITSNWAADSIQANKLLKVDKYLVDINWKSSILNVIGISSRPNSSRGSSPSRPSSSSSSVKGENLIKETKENRKKRLSSEKQQDLLTLRHSSSMSSPPSSTSDDEQLSKRRKLTTASRESSPQHQSTNERIIEILSQMSKEYSLESKTGVIGFKAISYRKAIESVKKSDKPVLTYDDAIKLPNVGHKIALKIEEIVKTGNLHQLDNLLNDEQHSILKLFSSVNGVGATVAHGWYSKGYKTLKDVVDNEHHLPRVVKNGLLYHDDWNTRIPRDEVLKHYEYIRDVAIKEVNPEIKLQLVGSYIRGSKDCGDIDMIMYIEGIDDVAVLQNTLCQLVLKLTDAKYIECDLVKVYPNMSKYMGGGNLSDLNDICRRVDIIYTPYSQLGASRIYFIGNDMFNRALRQLAKDKSMGLNQHGLFSDGDKTVLLESFSEKRILELLDVEWRDYTERNLGSIGDLTKR